MAEGSGSHLVHTRPQKAQKAQTLFRGNFNEATIVALGLLLSSALLFAQQPAAPLKGVPQFAADPKWPVLPDGFTWGQVIGIFADSKGHVWTSSRGRIAEWDQQGKLVQSWDARGPDGKWNTIHGLFVDHNGFVWTNARESNLTVKFTRTGQVALVIGQFDKTGGSNDTTLMGRPSEIWVDPADNDVRRRRLRQSPHHRVRRRHGEVPASLGRVRQATGRSSDRNQVRRVQRQVQANRFLPRRRRSFACRTASSDRATG